LTAGTLVMFWPASGVFVSRVEGDARTAGLMALRAVGVQIGTRAFLQGGRQVGQRGKFFKVRDAGSSNDGLKSPSRFNVRNWLSVTPVEG